MTFIYRLRAWLRCLFRRADFERALDEDLEDYIERSAAQKMRDGMSGEEARRRARLELGGVEQTKDRVRATLAFGPLETLLRDVRYALRSYRRHKTFTAVILLCLALGIGANTTVFSFLDSILLRSLPVADPESLVTLRWSVQEPGPEVPWPGMRLNFATNLGNGRVRSPVWSFEALERLAQSTEIVSDVIGRVPVSQIVVDDGDGPLANGIFVTGNYFSALGVRTVAGRGLTQDDDRFDAPPAVVLEERFSESRYGSAGAALGETLRLNGVTFTVVGVAPQEFFGVDPQLSPNFFIPLRSGPLFVTAGGDAGPPPVGNTQDMYRQSDLYWISSVARLRPGVALETANAALGASFGSYFAATFESEDAQRNPPVLELESARRGFNLMRLEYREPLLILFSMVLVILAVTCAGVASLLLSRAAARRPEMALRVSLGAGRAALIRQLLCEAVLLALLGGLLGVLVSLAGIELLTGLLSIGEDRALRATLSWPVLAATAGASIATGVLFGLAPALHATRVSVFTALKGSRTVDADPVRVGVLPARLRVGVGQALVVCQIALSLVLLIGASLFAATLGNLRSAELGYNPEGLLFTTVNAGRAGYSREELVQFYQSLRNRLLEQPGIEKVSYTWSPLAGGGVFGGTVAVPGMTSEPAPINIQIVGEGFFDTLEIPILRGRAISDQDISDARAVGIVDESFARTYFGDTDPIGRTIDVVDEGELTIIGVASDSRQDLIRNDVRPVVYYTYTWDPHELPTTNYELRTRDDPLAYGEQFRKIVRELDPSVIVAGTRTHTDAINRSIYREILFARLSEAFAALALLIACVALYGTVSYAMIRRTPEIGIRMALGASRGAVLRQSLRQVLGLGLAGLAIGVPAALLAAGYVESLLWGVSAHEPGVLVGAAAAALCAVALAGFVPARRASRIEPITALRSE